MKEDKVRIELEGESFETDGTEAARVTQLRVGPRTPVTLTFRDAMSVDRFLRFFSDQDGDDGWVGPQDVKKLIKKLDDRWTMAANNMSTAETNAAAAEWATRMREVEYAQQVLRRMTGGE